MRYGKASHISLILPLFKADALAKSLRALAHQRKASSLLRRSRGRATRVKLRRCSRRCSPETGSGSPSSRRLVQDLDKMHLPAVVRLRRSFWDDACNGTEKEKRQFVLRQRTGMSARCRTTTLELCSCAITGPHAEWLAGVLQEECWCSAQPWCTLISVTITSTMLGQTVLQECWGSAHR